MLDSSQCSSNERIVPKLHMALFTFESTLNSGVAGGPTLRCNEAHLGLRAPRTSRSLKTNRRAAQKIEGSWADLTVVIFLYAIIYSYVQLCIVIHKLTGAAYSFGSVPRLIISGPEIETAWRHPKLRKPCVTELLLKLVEKSDPS